MDTDQVIQSVAAAFPMRTAGLPATRIQRFGGNFLIGHLGREVTYKDAPLQEISPYDFVSTMSPGSLLFFGGSRVRSLKILLPYYMMYSLDTSLRKEPAVFAANVAPPPVSSADDQYREVLQTLHPKFRGSQFNELPIAEMLRRLTEPQRVAIANYLLCDKFSETRTTYLETDDGAAAVDFLSTLGPPSDTIAVLEIIMDPRKALAEAGALAEWERSRVTDYVDIVTRATGGQIGPSKTKLILNELVDAGLITGGRSTVAVMSKPEVFLDENKRSVSRISLDGLDYLPDIWR